MPSSPRLDRAADRNPDEIPVLPEQARQLKRPTVAMTSRTGRFGNRLQCAAYALATALEYGFKVKLYCLEHYDASLARHAGRPIHKHWRRLRRKILDWSLDSPFLQRLLRCRILDGDEIDPVILSSPGTLATIFSTRLTILPSYFTYCHPAILCKHREEIKKVLALNPAPADLKYLEQVRTEAGDILVGVHIRRGDYKDFGGGEYYYPLSHYGSLMRSLAESLEGKKVTFLACSDEPVPEDAFPGLDWRPGPGSLTGDLHALSVCDYILGPRSTFNLWSAFIGEVPRYEITRDSTSLSLSDFQREKDLYSQNYWYRSAD